MRSCGVLLLLASWSLVSCRSILGIEDAVAIDGGTGGPMLAFEFDLSGADEQSGTLRLPVVLSEPASVRVSVSYFGGSGSALQGSDFDVAAGMLTFEIGETRQEIVVTILNDTDEAEAMEDFTVSLSSPLGAEIDGARAIHTVRIADHILPRIRVKAATTTSGEASPSSFELVLDKPSEGPSTIVIGVAGGTPVAAGPADLTIVEGTVVAIPDGATSALVPIGEKDDLLDEEDSEFAVFMLKGPSVNLIIGTQATTTHAITDNDAPPMVRFTSATSNQVEGGVGVTMLTVTLSAASGRTVQVGYSRDNASTSDGADASVVGSPGTLTFSPGETSKSITVTLTNDIIDEDDESLIVQLTGATNATLGTATHTLTINDNDTSVVSFTLASSTVDEDLIIPTNLNVVMSAPSAKTVTVPFSVASAATSATVDDYAIQTASPLVFAPGQTTKVIAIDFPDNGPNNEPDETLALDIGTVTNALRGTPSRHTVTIVE